MTTRHPPAGFTFLATALLLSVAPAASAQDRRTTVFGNIGFASIGYADSEQGKAPIGGGSLSFRLTPRLVADGDVHRGAVRQVFGREHHDFSALTATASLLFRSSPDAPLHFVAGGGIGWQRVHSELTLDPVGRIESTDTSRLLHGRAGAEWDVSDRLVVRAESVLWFGSGLDWVVGGRGGIGYRF